MGLHDLISNAAEGFVLSKAPQVTNPNQLWKVAQKTNLCKVFALSMYIGVRFNPHSGRVVAIDISADVRRAC